jgi:hypothetical protein
MTINDPVVPSKIQEEGHTFSVANILDTNATFVRYFWTNRDTLCRYIPVDNILKIIMEYLLPHDCMFSTIIDTPVLPKRISVFNPSHEIDEHSSILRNVFKVSESQIECLNTVLTDHTKRFKICASGKNCHGDYIEFVTNDNMSITTPTINLLTKEDKVFATPCCGKIFCDMCVVKFIEDGKFCKFVKNFMCHVCEEKKKKCDEEKRIEKRRAKEFQDIIHNMGFVPNIRRSSEAEYEAWEKYENGEHDYYSSDDYSEGLSDYEEYLDNLHNPTEGYEYYEEYLNIINWHRRRLLNDAEYFAEYE